MVYAVLVTLLHTCTVIIFFATYIVVMSRPQGLKHSRKRCMCVACMRENDNMIGKIAPHLQHLRWLVGGSSQMD